MLVHGKEVSVKGRVIRIGRLAGEGYLFLEEDPEPLLVELRERHPRVDLFTFTQRVPNTVPKYHYPMEWDNCAAIAVTTFEQWWSQQIRAEARNRARQAEKKGVCIREVLFSADLAQGIHAIYNEEPVRGGRRFPHYGKDVQTVYKEAATYLDKSIFIGAFFEDVLIGFVKLTVDDTGTQANLMNILSMVQHRDKAPTNALIAHAVKACASRTISYLVYQRYTYGNKAPDGIVKFKEVNGFKRIDLPRYYVALTSLGRIAFRFGLHRRLVERIPAVVTDQALKVRQAWNKYALGAVRETASL